MQPKFERLMFSWNTFPFGDSLLTRVLRMRFGLCSLPALLFKFANISTTVLTFLLKTKVKNIYFSSLSKLFEHEKEGL